MGTVVGADDGEGKDGRGVSVGDTTAVGVSTDSGVAVGDVVSPQAAATARLPISQGASAIRLLELGKVIRRR